MGWYEFSEETVKPVAPAANHLALYPKAGEWYFETPAGIEKKLLSSMGLAQVQVAYVGKHGNDGNLGNSLEYAFLTFAAAIAYVNAQSPSQYNPWAIVCLDGGVYIESITLLAYVGLFAPNASFIGNMVIGDGCSFEANAVICTSGIALAKTSGTISGQFKLGLCNLSGTAIGVQCTSGSLDFNIDTFANQGTGACIGGASTSHIHGQTNTIYLLSASGGYGVRFTSSGSCALSIGAIEDINFSTAIATSGTATVNAIVGNIACLNAVNVGAGSTLNLLVSKLTGTEANAGTYNVTKAGVTALHGTAAHTGTIGAHSQLSGVGADDHHAKQHALDSTADHSALSDNTNLDASTSNHGLMKKYPGGTTTFLRADGTFAATPPRKIVQTANASVAVDTTTTSLTWVDLLSITMTTAASILDVFFSIGCNYDPDSGKDSNIYFRITVDTVAKWGTGGHGINNQPIAASIKWAGTVTAASHVVAAQWKLAGKGTGAVRPVTVPDWQHAQMIVYEVEPA